MRRHILTGIAALAALGVSFGSAQAQAAKEKAKISIGMSVVTSTYLPLYLAEQEGYFKQEGIDVELVAFKGGTDMVRGMVAGAIDIGVGALSEALVGVETGQGIKVFYAGFNMVVFDWYAVSSVKSMADTRGKRFGVTTFGSSTDFMTRYALKVEGIDAEKDVKIIQGGASAPRLAAMEAGQLDVNIFATPEKFMAADMGYRKILSQSDLAKDYPFHVFYADEKFLKENPNAVRAVLRGFIRGLRAARADKEKSVKLLAQKVGFEDKYLRRAYDEFMPAIFEDGRLPSDEGMKVFWDMGIQSGVYKERWPLDKFWVRTFRDTYEQWRPQ